MKQKQTKILEIVYKMPDGKRSVFQCGWVMYNVHAKCICECVVCVFENSQNVSVHTILG